MGVVFEVEHLRLKQRCAIKVLIPEQAARSEVVARFEREGHATARLKSRHVARVMDVATSPNGIPYMVMELLAGHDLEEEIKTTGALPVEVAADYVLQACAGLAVAHAAGIVHRDLKPSNLFLAGDDDGCALKLLDFGVSKFVDDEQKLTAEGSTVGTALYMPPEQLQSIAEVDERSDIWSLGVILYELLSGTLPFKGTIMRVAAAIASQDAPSLAGRSAAPPALVALVQSMMQRDPRDRPESVLEVASALLPFASPDSVGAESCRQLLRRHARGSDAAFTTAAVSSPTMPALSPVSAHGAPPKRWPMLVAFAAAITLAAGGSYLAFSRMAPAGPSTAAYIAATPPAETKVEMTSPAASNVTLPPPPPPLAASASVVSEPAPSFARKHAPPTVSAAAPSTAAKPVAEPPKAPTPKYPTILSD